MLVKNKTLQRKVDLLFLLTYKEIALKYKRTVLGILWSLLNPILLASVYYVAFKIFMRFEVKNYTFFLLSALFPWNWFLTSIIINSRTLVNNVALIKKVVFPRHYLVVSVIIAQLVNLLFSIPIMILLSIQSGQGPSLNWILGIILLVIVQFIFTFGISLLVSIGNAFLRDIEYLVGIVLNLIFWMTPIIYPISSIPAPYDRLFLLNPLTSLFAAWRGLFLENRILWNDIGISFAMAVIIFYFSYLLFHRLERRLDEVL